LDSVQVITTSIKPDLERLRSDKAEFLAWQKACSDEEQLGHLVVAHRYWRMLRKQRDDAKYITQVQEGLAELDDDHKGLKVRTLLACTLLYPSQRD
jgi:hypothetical protein